MAFNITLFVQAAHFLIAYFLLRMIFIKPAYALLMCLEKEERQKQAGLHVLSENVRAHERELRSSWNECKKQMTSAKPCEGEVMSQYISRLSSLEHSLPEFDTSTVKALSQEVAHTIAEKIVEKGK